MMLKIINSAINTKALSRWSTLACNIALDAVRTVELEDNGRKEIDIKKYAKVEKVGYCWKWHFYIKFTQKMCIVNGSFKIFAITCICLGAWWLHRGLLRAKRCDAK